MTTRTDSVTAAVVVATQRISEAIMNGRSELQSAPWEWKMITGDRKLRWRETR